MRGLRLSVRLFRGVWLSGPIGGGSNNGAKVRKAAQAVEGQAHHLEDKAAELDMLVARLNRMGASIDAVIKAAETAIKTGSVEGLEPALARYNQMAAAETKKPQLATTRAGKPASDDCVY
jgi:hypothetical protein